MKKLLQLCISGLMTLGLAQAGWFYHIEDDLFNGKKATLIGEMSQGGVLFFECKKGEVPTLALLLSHKDSDPDLDIPVLMVLKVDRNEPIAEFGRIQKRNENYVAVYYLGNNILQILKEIRDGKQQVLAGYKILSNDYNNSLSGNVYKSTVGVNQFVKACGISLH